MEDIVWHSPKVEDIEKIKEITTNADFMGNDLSYANIFLLKDKYDIKISFYKNCLLRKYNGTKSRSGYGFPIGKSNIDKALFALKNEAENQGDVLKFCLLSEKQTKMLKNTLNCKCQAEINEGDGDYIYLQSDLAQLNGKKFQKKRNHISKFNRTYDDFHFEKLNSDNKADVMKVTDIWFSENKDADTSELTSIHNALKYYDSLHLFGYILYVKNLPVSFCIASKINPKVCDVHYEKSIGEYAKNGAYALINNFFAKEAKGYEFINREEDIGNEGLRKAKRSYYPHIVLYKYYISYFS